MKRRIVFALLFLWFLVFGPGLFAFGKKEASADTKPLNTEWTLCITAFDTSAMSPSWQTAGDTVTRSLVGALQNLDFRFRGEEETAYHQNYAWAKARATAADAVAKKRNERDLLIFKGDADWKYRKDLKTTEGAIVKLEEALAEVDSLAPEVEGKPFFKLDARNLTGAFPPPPEPGRENRFCADQKADAFLAGSLSEYYGRMFLEIKMYTRYSGSYTYEDNVLFSSEDFNQVMDELASRLAFAVSENFPSAVMVRVTPPEAIVLIDGIFVGQREMEFHTRSPGEAEISVQADNHIPVSFPVELHAGELTELFIDLTPLGLSAFEVNVPASPGSVVYLGSLYVGEAPLTLQLPLKEFSYISVETPEGEIGSAIYRDNTLIRGNAEFTRTDDFQGRADFVTAMPPSEEEKKVGKARRFFYTHYGALWFILPAAFITSGIAKTYMDANAHVERNNLYDPETRAEINARASLASNVRIAGFGVMGATLGATFYQIFRYIRASAEDSTPMVKVLPKEEPVSSQDETLLSHDETQGEIVPSEEKGEDGTET